MVSDLKSAIGEAARKTGMLKGAINNSGEQAHGTNQTITVITALQARPACWR